MKIPKIIHFIWAGGDDKLKKEYAKSVRNWREKNPSFKLWLWVDKKSAANEASWANILADFRSSLPDSVQLKDIENEKGSDGKSMADEYIRYEIDKLKPNYGSSSDLLRYKILFRFGGAYFDFDISPGATSLANSGIFNKSYKYHCLYVSKNSQNSGRIGNDAFICTPGNPYMQRMYDTAINHYTLRIDSPSYDPSNYFHINVSTDNSPVFLAYYDEDKQHRYDSIPNRTGPLVTRLAIGAAMLDEREQTELQRVIEQKHECCNLIFYQKIHPIISHMNGLTIPFDCNGGTWLKPKKSIQLEEEKLLARLTSTIKFEAEKSKILRLDDHVKWLILLARFDENKAIHCIFRILVNLRISCSQLTGIQLTFSYRKTIDFCHVNQLMEKTFLFPLSEACQNMVDVYPYYGNAVRNVMSVNKYEDIKKQLDNGKYKNREESRFTKDSALSSYTFLRYALGFCDFLFEDTHSELNKSLFAYLEDLIKIIENGVICLLDEICKATDSERFKILREKLRENKESIVAFVKEKKSLVNSENKSQSKSITTISPYNLFYIKSRGKDNIHRNDEKYGKDEVKYLPQQRSNMP
jgi:mannosyltransferase OCH1-like enzyme